MVNPDKVEMLDRKGGEMPAKKKSRKVVKVSKKAPVKARPAYAGKMSEEMMNAMLMLFAGGMLVLAFVLYFSYA